MLDRKQGAIRGMKKTNSVRLNLGICRLRDGWRVKTVKRGEGAAMNRFGILPENRSGEIEKEQGKGQKFERAGIRVVPVKEEKGGCRNHIWGNFSKLERRKIAPRRVSVGGA